ncbi:Hypothetical protein ORPV_875 [Orpheovirus IHUMI-LCC2]|uniref:Uncharacterized protein n=1 Tax=Orpheovirus IHUMI-LCC2 TaxID=2023057 RepID=A0A2I2L5P8_9VIRU|nr:Hypothetical protein ORPV_875 [Orpheovirus IHUMI-LCC2]SNW62779.1 Hypothetical protein ORPV_875 [Orpheovirus IHUMI-LCC2]
MEYIEKIKEFIKLTYPNLEILYEWVDNENIYIPNYLEGLIIHIKCKGCGLNKCMDIFTCRNYSYEYITFCHPFQSIYKKNTTTSERAWNEFPKYYVRLLEDNPYMRRLFKGECCNRHLINQLADILCIDNNKDMNNAEILNNAIFKLQNIKTLFDKL